MQLKICGLRENENVRTIAGLKPDWMGFIFYDGSPRYFKNAKIEADIASLPVEIKRVGVFVNENKNEVQRLYQLYGFHFVQLHGDETPEYCKHLFEKGIKIIKAFRVDDTFDTSVTEPYLPYVEMFLFDAAGKGFGGNGIAFNWNVLEGKRFFKPFLLSGGIGLDEVTALQAFHHPDMIGVDVNSRFEISPGLKDVVALETFKMQIQ